jgi:hypothetical protein
VARRAAAIYPAFIFWRLASRSGRGLVCKKEFFMNRMLMAALAVVSGCALAGCYSPAERAVGGGAIGGLGGAGIGAAVSNGSTTGTLAGAAIGAATGAALGAATAPPPPPPPPCAQWGWDDYGNRICIGYY